MENKNRCNLIQNYYNKMRNLNTKSNVKCRIFNTEPNIFLL